MINFNTRGTNSIEDILNIGKLMEAGGLTNEEVYNLKRIREAWNFYEGFHWENIEETDSVQVTYNYCRPYVNKFVAFEFGEGFSISMPVDIENVPVTVGDEKIDHDLDGDGNLQEDEINEEPIIREKTEVEYLNQVWKNNKKEELLTSIGQMKSITGDAWVKVNFEEAGDFKDPFEEYPNGRIRLACVPTQYVFPRYNDHDKDTLEELLIMYPIHEETETGLLFKRKSETTVIYRELWTDEEIVVYKGGTEIDRMENPYGFVPFVHIKNFPIAGRTRGQGDIEDLIPLNVEYNIKKSDMSEVIDYHSAPITLVYGAKIGNLEKGANKVWGGLPKDAKVENLELQGNLAASRSYVEDLKTSMCEITGVPEMVLGGAVSVSNTSGVTMHYINLPLIERTNVKRSQTNLGLQEINKMILYISYVEGLIEKPEEISMKDFLSNTVELKDTLPKDILIELQVLQQELSMGLECRHGAMERLGKSDVARKIIEIDKERLDHPELFNPMLQTLWYQNQMQMQGNSNAGGMMNGQTTLEQLRVETTGQNGGGNQIK